MEEHQTSTSQNIESTCTWKIANVRVHVERVRGAVHQKFSILLATGVLGKDLVKKINDGVPLDPVVRVCCALIICAELFRLLKAYLSPNNNCTQWLLQIYIWYVSETEMFRCTWS